jgi:hypothetical protein
MKRLKLIPWPTTVPWLKAAFWLMLALAAVFLLLSSLLAPHRPAEIIPSSQALALAVGGLGLLALGYAFLRSSGLLSSLGFGLYLSGLVLAAWRDAQPLALLNGACAVLAAWDLAGHVALLRQLQQTHVPAPTLPLLAFCLAVGWLLGAVGLSLRLGLSFEAIIGLGLVAAGTLAAAMRYLRSRDDTSI